MLPIAVHLLVRQPIERYAFPSLRFLGETQLAAFRRGAVQDLVLLLCRIAIIALAAMALAGPVLRSDARMAAFSARIARAIVVIDTADDSTLARLRGDAFATATFSRARAGDAIADALRWLGAQPPASREIVITGPLRRGAVSDAILAGVPAGVGVRFEPVAFDASPEATQAILARRNGSLVRIERIVSASIDATSVTDGPASPLPDDLITIHAATPDRDLAAAALRAALDAGVPWSDFTTAVAIVWDGADGPAGSTLRVLRMPVPQPPSSAADAVRARLVAAAGGEQLKEPVPITAEQLALWTRPPGPASPDAPLGDEGDRRWLWAAVLVLLMIEWWLRRTRLGAAATVDAGEARVA